VKRLFTLVFVVLKPSDFNELLIETRDLLLETLLFLEQALFRLLLLQCCLPIFEHELLLIQAHSLERLPLRLFSGCQFRRLTQLRFPAFPLLSQCLLLSLEFGQFLPKSDQALPGLSDLTEALTAVMTRGQRQ